MLGNKQAIPGRQVRGDVTSFANTSALSFDGTDDLVNLGNATETRVTSATFSVWFKFNGGGATTNTIFYHNGGGYRIQFDQTTKKIIFSVYDGAWDDLTQDTAFAQDVWYHLAATYDGDADVSKIFIDGVLDGEKASVGAPSHSTSDVTIASTVSTQFFGGQLDQFRLFNRALNSQEIGELYRRDVVPSGLVGEWLFDEGEGSTATDTSSNSNDGTITGATYVTTGLPGSL